MRSSRFDIRLYKRQLRELYKQRRDGMDKEQKAERDIRICRSVERMPAYRRAEVVLTFVSTGSEIDTHTLIRRALEKGKRVAVPYCIDGTRDMDFYLITSLDQLVPRTFGVLEPDPARCEKLTSFHNSICILPGLTFDRKGYRLGYGGGYYDRFLTGKYKGGVTVGICYGDFIHKGLIHGRYDAPCQYIATEQGVRRVWQRT